MVHYGGGGGGDSSGGDGVDCGKKGVAEFGVFLDGVRRLIYRFSD